MDTLLAKKVFSFTKSKKISKNLFQDPSLSKGIEENLKKKISLSKVKFKDYSIESVWQDHNEKKTPYYVITICDNAWKLPENLKFKPVKGTKVSVATFDKNSYEYKNNFSHLLIFHDSKDVEVFKLLTTKDGRVASVEIDKSDLTYKII
jgi:hypothetical protein